MRTALVPAALVLGALLCFGASGWMAGQLAGSGQNEVGKVASAPETPAGVRFVTVALGGLRGLLVDALWVRAARLQDEGNFFEVAQLAEWITRLEPRYPEVWSYQAWNLSYNISAMFPDPADRWHWVGTGVRLLRDEGIPANSREAKLYWELGWLFADKIGGRWDEAQFYYRARLAEEATAVVGGGAFDRASVLNGSDRSSRLAAAGLVPDVMAQLDERFGPLDWRLPETFALYWGTRGRPYQKPDARWCERLIWSSLTDEVRGGALYFDPAAHLYLRGPRPDIAIKGIRQCGQQNPFESPLSGLAAETFLREAMVTLFAFGRPDESEAALAMLERRSGVAKTSTLAVAVKEELVLRLEGVDRGSGRKMTGQMLSNAYMWTALGKADYARGVTALARLHWEALARPAGAADEPDVWTGLCRDAKLQAIASLPASYRAILESEP